MIVQAVVYGNNADLISEVASLYATDDSKIADLTYGKGVFWRKTPHLRVFGSDLITQPKRPHDFTNLPYRDATFNIAVLDPPYIHSPGKHQTDSRYQNAATTKGMLWADLRRELYIPGMREAMRIVKPQGGQIWVKCKDQVQSGMHRWCHAELLHDALELGLYPRDLFILMAKSRTSNNRWSVQHHARKPHSFLWVFQRPTAAQAKQIKREHLYSLQPCPSKTSQQEKLKNSGVSCTFLKRPLDLGKEHFRNGTHQVAACADSLNDGPEASKMKA